MSDMANSTASGRKVMSLLATVGLVVVACSPPQVASPTETTPDDMFSMFMEDCEGDCDQPAVNFGGTFYVATIRCEPIASDAIGEIVALPDPESPILVPYSEARLITGIDRKLAVALGPESPPGCAQERSSWWAARGQNHLDDEELGEALRALAP